MMSNAQAALLSATTLLADGKWAGQPTEMAGQFKTWLDKQDKDDERADIR